MTRTLSELVQQGRLAFVEAGLPDAAGDARVLVLGLLHLETKDLLLNPEREVGEADQTRVEQAFARRIAREPVYRILGWREFYGLPFRLSAETLEPRPDTEVLVDAVLPVAREIVERKGQAKLVDLGTGTGAIALALLHEVPHLKATGADISANALETARENADLLNVGDRFKTVRSDWFSEIDGRFDIIVSNPPYIQTDVIAALEPEVRDHDPMAALDGGPDGLQPYHIIARDAEFFLEAGGVVAVEIGFDQKDAVIGIFKACGYTLIRAVRDLGGNDRGLLFSRENIEIVNS